MLKDLFRNHIYPIATLSGSIIGVGFLALPYIALQVGIWQMVVYLAAITALVVFIHLIFGEISLSTPDYKRFPGFVKFYLGKWPERATLILTIFGSFGVLLVYLIIGGQFLAAIFSPFLGGGAQVYVLVYFLIAASVIYFDIKIISKIEFWAIVLLLALLAIVFMGLFPGIKLSNIFSSGFKFSFPNLFLPYGPILFSLWGTGLIPEMEEMLRGRKNLLKINIALGTIIPSLIYFLFILLVLGLTGRQTTDSALIGIKNIFGDGITSAALFIGLVTTFTAFVSQGFLLKKTFVYDMNFNKNFSWVFTCLPPLVLFLFGFNAFIPLISFIGAVFLGINGIFIMLIYKKIGGKNTVIYPLTALFILGIVYETIYFVK